MTRLLLALALLFATIPALADAPPTFRDEAEEQRFRELTSELRCVMCQNQSLADSNALIAHDLRIEILRMMREGRSDQQIKQFLVERYTDFVLYEPEVAPKTWVLWFGAPIALLVVIAGLLIARRRPAAPPPPLTAQEQARLSVLLDKSE